SASESTLFAYTTLFRSESDIPVDGLIVALYSNDESYVSAYGTMPFNDFLHLIYLNIHNEWVVRNMDVLIEKLPFLEHMIKSVPFLLEGLKYTLLITLIGVAIGFVIGAFAGLARISKNFIIYGISTIYVEIVRVTPILVQILFIYFALPDLLDLNLDKITASIIAIAINAGAYIAEIVRGGVESIDEGQFEAGDSIGLTKNQTMWHIIWPQAFRRMIPPL